jgi:hypothetical protein
MDQLLLAIVLRMEREIGASIVRTVLCALALYTDGE